MEWLGRVESNDWFARDLGRNQDFLWTAAFPKIGETRRAASPLRREPRFPTSSWPERRAVKQGVNWTSSPVPLRPSSGPLKAQSL